MGYYLVDNPPRRSQYRKPRRQKPTGTIVVESEQVFEWPGAASTAPAVARPAVEVRHGKAYVLDRRLRISVSRQGLVSQALSPLVQDRRPAQAAERADPARRAILAEGGTHRRSNRVLALAGRHRHRRVRPDQHGIKRRDVQERTGITGRLVLGERDAGPKGSPRHASLRQPAVLQPLPPRSRHTCGEHGRHDAEGSALASGADALQARPRVHVREHRLHPPRYSSMPGVSTDQGTEWRR